MTGTSPLQLTSVLTYSCHELFWITKQLTQSGRNDYSRITVTTTPATCSLFYGFGIMCVVDTAHLNITEYTVPFVFNIAVFTTILLTHYNLLLFPSFGLKNISSISTSIISLSRGVWYWVNSEMHLSTHLSPNNSIIINLPFFNLYFHGLISTMCVILGK